MKNLFVALSYCPLWLLHIFGAVLGWLAFACSKSYRKKFLTHSKQAGYTIAQIWPAISHAGCMAAELPRLWLGKALPYRLEGRECLEQALDRTRQEGRGLLLLTPHLGCFEMTAQAYASEFVPKTGKAITVLYRPAKQAWLRTVMEGNRQRPGLQTAPTNLSGVKQLIKALRSGEAVGLLPDQVPPQGMGVWLPFFGRQAYTMTLPARLVQLAQPEVLLTWGERLSWGRGFVVHYKKIELQEDATTEQLSLQINQAMEKVIRLLPQQYIWEYERYKAPKP